MVVVVAVLGGEDLSHSVDRRTHPGRVTGRDLGDDVPEAELVGSRERDVALVPAPLALHRVRLGVGLDGLGAGDLEDGRRRVAGNGPGHRDIDEPRLVGKQPAGHRGHPPSHPGLAFQRNHPCPGEREPVLEVEHVGHHRTGTQRVLLARHGELGQRILAHAGRAVSARPDQRVLVVTRLPLPDRPTRHHLELSDLGPTASRHPRRDRLEEVALSQVLQRRDCDVLGNRRDRHRSLPLEHLFESRSSSAVCRY